MTSPGFIKRLIWPGLLLVSLTSNLCFACLYMYHNWRWTVDGSAAVLSWPAQSESASGLWQPCRVCRPGGYSAMPENITFLAAIYCLLMLMVKITDVRFSTAYLLFHWSFYKKTLWWNQILRLWICDWHTFSFWSGLVGVCPLVCHFSFYCSFTWTPVHV